MNQTNTKKDENAPGVLIVMLHRFFRFCYFGMSFAGWGGVHSVPDIQPASEEQTEDFNLVPHPGRGHGHWTLPHPTLAPCEAIQQKTNNLAQQHNKF
jgi:hypothetical protein